MCDLSAVVQPLREGCVCSCAGAGGCCVFDGSEQQEQVIVAPESDDVGENKGVVTCVFAQLTMF